jgi:hypothetical protein
VPQNAKYADLAVNTKVDALAALLNGGYIDIYDGAQPATADTVVTTQTKLARLTFSSTAFAAGSGGIAVANAITPDADAAATGTAAWARMVTSAGAAVMDGTAGTSGCNLNLATTAIVQHATVSASNLSLREPKG